MVDYPIKIPPDTEELWAGRTSGHRCGPFFHGTTIYTFLLQIVTKFTDAHIEAWKSMDQGETWEQLDSANDPNVDGVSFQMHFDAQAHFDLDVIPRIYCLYLDDSNGDLRVHPFNTVKDIWEARSVAGPTPLSAASMQMARRPTGVNQIEFPITYAGPQDSGFNRVYYTVYRNTDSWDTGVRLFGALAESETYAATTRAEGQPGGVGQGRVHFFAKQGSASGVHRSVESNDTINAQEVVDATGNPRWGTPKSGSEIVAPYRDAITTLKVARATSSASMSWTVEEVYDETDPSAQIGARSTCVEKSDGTLRVHFEIDPDSFATTTNLYYAEDPGGGAWGDKQLVHSETDPTIAATQGPINAAAKGDAIGVLYNLKIGDVGGPVQAHYTQDGVLAPDAGMINQVDTVSGGGYVVA